MAKNRNKKRKDVVSMDVTEATTNSDAPQAMDTSETGDKKPATRIRNMTNVRKGSKPMKRTKNARKMKAVAKAIALNEKYTEKASKNETKTLRTLSAKKLYE